MRRSLTGALLAAAFVIGAFPAVYPSLPDGARAKISPVVAAVARSEAMPDALSSGFRGWARPILDDGAVREPSRPGVAGMVYDRNDYGGWIDEDGDCEDTRAEVLRALSTSVVAMRKSGCTVGHGRWNDPYSGRVLTEASDVDIDHVVPLAWAHRHGADAWPPERKRAFANWQPNLMAVDARLNRQKGAKGPDEWLPPNEAYRCEYVTRFRRIVLQWEMAVGPEEAAALERVSANWCGAR